jgi:hypothetical protein
VTSSATHLAVVNDEVDITRLLAGLPGEEGFVPRVESA